MSTLLKPPECVSMKTFKEIIKAAVPPKICPNSPTTY